MEQPLVEVERQRIKHMVGNARYARATFEDFIGVLLEWVIKHCVGDSGI